MDINYYSSYFYIKELYNFILGALTYNDAQMLPIGNITHYAVGKSR